jgi:hypothetical protein
LHLSGCATAATKPNTFVMCRCASGGAAADRVHLPGRCSLGGARWVTLLAARTLASSAARLEPLVIPWHAYNAHTAGAATAACSHIVQLATAVMI